MSSGFGRGDVDRFDEAANVGFYLVGKRLAGGDRRSDAANVLAIGFDNLRVKDDHRDRVLLAELGARAIALLDLPGQRLAQLGELAAAVGDRGDEALNGGHGLGELPFPRGPGPPALAKLPLALEVELAHQDRHRFRREQLLLEAGEDAGLQLPQLQAAVVAAGAGLAGATAGEPRIGDDRHRAAAEAALDQAREEVARALAIDEGLAGAAP